MPSRAHLPTNLPLGKTNTILHIYNFPHTHSKKVRYQFLNSASDLEAHSLFTEYETERYLFALHPGSVLSYFRYRHSTATLATSCAPMSDWLRSFSQPNEKPHAPVFLTSPPMRALQGRALEGINWGHRIYQNNLKHLCISDMQNIDTRRNHFYLANKYCKIIYSGTYILYVSMDNN